MCISGSIFDRFQEEYKKFCNEIKEKYCNKFLVGTDLNEPYYIGKVINFVDIRFDRAIIEVDPLKNDEHKIYPTQSTINIAIWQLYEAVIFDTAEDAELFMELKTL